MADPSPTRGGGGWRGHSGEKTSAISSHGSRRTASAASSSRGSGLPGWGTPSRGSRGSGRSGGNWSRSRSRRPTGWPSAAISPSAVAGPSADPPSDPRTLPRLSRAARANDSTALGKTQTRRPLRVLNHLNRAALRHYAEVLMQAFAEALRGSTSRSSATRSSSTRGGSGTPCLWDRFAERFGYRLEGLVDQIDDDPDLRYDYRTIIAETILREFYVEFAEICREHGALSQGAVPRVANRLARSLRGGGHPRVGGDPVQSPLLADRGFGCRSHWKAGRQRRDVHMPLRFRVATHPRTLPLLAQGAGGRPEAPGRRAVRSGCESGGLAWHAVQRPRRA